MAWTQFTVVILLLYVFFRDFRPSESFLTPYLNKTKHFSKHEINNMIYPVWSYSQLPFIIIVFATTDLLKYRPIIWAGALGYVTTWLLLLFGKTVRDMQFMQVTYAIGTACEIGYKSYVFVAVPKEDYSRVSLYLSGAALFGKSMSSLLSQILSDYASMTYLQLNFLSLASVLLALLLSLLIRKPQFLQPSKSAVNQMPSEDAAGLLDSQPSCWEKTCERATIAWDKAKLSYGSAQTRRWAYWAIVTTTLYYMVGNSAQSLWKDLEHDKAKRYNGYVNGITCLLSSLVSWILARYSKTIEKTPVTTVALLTLLVSATTLLPTIIQNLYLAYCCDCIFNIIISSIMTITTFKIAHSLKTDLYGFVVGLNVCVAGLIDLLFTFIFMDEHALSFNPRQQYWAYTGFAVFNVAMFAVHKCVCATFFRGDEQLLPPNEEVADADEPLLGLDQ